MTPIDSAAECASGTVTSVATTLAPSTAVDPRLLQPRCRHRQIIALTLALVLAAIVMAFFLFGPPSVAASGGCGG
jgi:hypothetical protein